MIKDLEELKEICAPYGKPDAPLVNASYGHGRSMDFTIAVRDWISVGNYAEVSALMREFFPYPDESLYKRYQGAYEVACEFDGNALGKSEVMAIIILDDVKDLLPIVMATHGLTHPLLPFPAFSFPELIDVSPMARYVLAFGNDGGYDLRVHGNDIDRAHYELSKALAKVKDLNSRAIELCNHVLPIFKYLGSNYDLLNINHRIYNREKEQTHTEAPINKGNIRNPELVKRLKETLKKRVGSEGVDENGRLTLSPREMVEYIEMKRSTEKIDSDLLARAKADLRKRLGADAVDENGRITLSMEERVKRSEAKYGVSKEEHARRVEERNKGKVPERKQSPEEFKES